MAFFFLFALFHLLHQQILGLIKEKKKKKKKESGSRSTVQLCYHKSNLLKNSFMTDRDLLKSVEGIVWLCGHN